MTTSLQFWISGVNNETSINIHDKVVPRMLKFYNIHWIRGLQARISTIRLSDAFNDYKFTFWMSGVNNGTSIKNLYRMETEKIKFYIIDWVRRLQARIFTIMNEWCLQWQEVYKFE